MWPNCGFNIGTRASKCLNGSHSRYWRIILVWKITIDVDNNNKEFWTAVLVMPSAHAAWPYNMANNSHMASVPKCLCTLKSSDRLIRVCIMSCFHSIWQYAPWNCDHKSSAKWDQLCGHVYVAWPNYSNDCCRQQIKISSDSRPKVVPELHCICPKCMPSFQNNFSIRFEKSWDYKLIFVFSMT